MTIYKIHIHYYGNPSRLLISLKENNKSGERFESFFVSTIIFNSAQVMKEYLDSSPVKKETEKQIRYLVEDSFSSDPFREELLSLWVSNTLDELFEKILARHASTANEEANTPLTRILWATAVDSVIKDFGKNPTLELSFDSD